MPPPSPVQALFLGAMMFKVPAWTDARRITLCTNGQTMEAETEARARAAGMRIETRAIARFDADATAAAGEHKGATVAFESGDAPLRVAAAYYMPTRHQASPLLERLGAKLQGPGMFWQRVVTDMFGTTGVAGMYAIGDAGSSAAEQIVGAASSGLHAAVHANGELLKAGVRPAALVPVGAPAAASAV